MNVPYVLGIDVGTSGVKSVVFDVTGTSIAQESVEYPLIVPQPGWVEQDPNEWWQAVRESVCRLTSQRPEVAKCIRVVSVTGQQPSPVLLDETGRALSNAISWMDRRTVEECEVLVKRIGAERIYEITGLRPDPMYLVYKAMWVRQNKREMFDRTWKIIQPKDYINFRLTGEVASDCASAGATQAMEIRHLAWDQGILDAAGIPADLMPEIRKPTDVLGTLIREVAIDLGLCPDTEVVVGAGDSTLSALGCGVVNPGETAIIVGSSSDVLTCVSSPVIDPAQRVGYYPYLVSGTYLAVAGANTSAAAFKWFKDAFGSCTGEPSEDPRLDTYDALLEAAAKVRAGCEGLIFLPYLSGERSPVFNPKARGVFAGISMNHTRAHFARAVLEGVSISLKDRLRTMEELGLVAGRVVLSGGGVRARLWQQIIADAVGHPIYLTDTVFSTARGAAIVGAVGVGLHSSVESACRAMVRVTGTVQPEPSNIDVYESVYVLYKDLYSLSEPFFSRLERFASRLGRA